MPSALRTAAILMTTALAFGSRCLAAEPIDTCTTFRIAAAQSVVATKTCSDAYYVRRSVLEGDTICELADAPSAAASQGWLDMAKAGPGGPSGYCLTDYKPLARKMLAASEWLQKVNGFRLDHRNAMPPPFPITIDEDGN